jgi:hypothetical protein
MGKYLTYLECTIQEKEFIIFIFVQKRASNNYRIQWKNLNTSVPFANQQLITKTEKKQPNKALIVKKEINVKTVKKRDASYLNAVNAKKLNTAKNHVKWLIGLSTKLFAGKVVLLLNFHDDLL